MLTTVSSVKKRKLRAVAFQLCMYAPGAVVVSFTIMRDRDGVFLWTFEPRIDNWVLLIIAQYTNTAAVALLKCSQRDFVTPLPILGYSIHVICKYFTTFHKLKISFRILLQVLYDVRSNLGVAIFAPVKSQTQCPELTVPIALRLNLFTVMPGAEVLHAEPLRSLSQRNLRLSFVFAERETPRTCGRSIKNISIVSKRRSPRRTRARLSEGTRNELLHVLAHARAVTARSTPPLARTLSRSQITDFKGLIRWKSPVSNQFLK